jgi:hypothetical protein
MAATIAHRGRISTNDSRFEFGRTSPTQIFQFSQLRKTKAEGLLELFWGEQPPFMLLRSVGGGTFFGVGRLSQPQISCAASPLYP